MDSGQWSIIIRPKARLLDINLKELWEYRYLIYLFVRRDFIARYKQTILGPLWFIIQPLLTTFMFTIVFGKIAKISTEGIPGILFYLSGLTIWNYFSRSLTGTANTFVANANLFGKVYFPRLIVPISVVISNLIQFLIQLGLLLSIMVYYLISGLKITLDLTVLLLPIYVILAGILGLGFGLISSSLTTKYRDLMHLITFGMQLWLYATPIVYPLSQVPQKYKFWIKLNPVTPLVEGFRHSLLGVGEFNVGSLIYSCIFAIVILFLGIIIFSRVERNFMDTV